MHFSVDFSEGMIMTGDQMEGLIRMFEIWIFCKDFRIFKNLCSVNNFIELFPD